MPDTTHITWGDHTADTPNLMDISFYDGLIIRVKEKKVKISIDLSIQPAKK